MQNVVGRQRTVSGQLLGGLAMAEKPEHVAEIENDGRNTHTFLVTNWLVARKSKRAVGEHRRRNFLCLRLTTIASCQRPWTTARSNFV